MNTPSLRVNLGPLELANPVIAASSEFTMYEDNIRACVDAGAGAVVAKSVNEKPAARKQLAIADYVLVGDSHDVMPWDEPDPRLSLFNQSGLAPTALDDWLAMLERCEQYARQRGSRIIGSITVADPGPAATIAAEMASVVSAVELNLSAPHGKDSAGAVKQIGAPETVAEYTSAVRAATDVPLIVKLTAQSVSVTDLATAAIAAGADVVAMIGRFQGFLPRLDDDTPVLGSVGAIGGPWALPLSLYWVRATHLALPTTPIVGTNGARNGADVLRFLLAGARAVELASAILIGGPQVITDALDDVRRYLTARHIDEVQDLIGTAARAARSYAELLDERADRPLQFPWDRHRSDRRHDSR